MKSKRAALLTLLVLALFCLAAPAWAASRISIVVDGSPVQTDAAPRLVNGRVQVPLRVISEALGAEVEYQEVSGSIFIFVKNYNCTDIELKIGSSEAKIHPYRAEDLTTLKLDGPVRLYGDRAFVPLRFVAEALGAQVDWQDAKQQVSITSARFEDTEPAFVNAEGRALHSMTQHTYMTIGGWLDGYWGHAQVAEAWRLLTEGRGAEVAAPERYSRQYNMDWNNFYYLDREVCFYEGEPVYSESGNEQADYHFQIYEFTMLFDDGSVRQPAADAGEYLILDLKRDKWYILPAAKYEAFMAIRFPLVRQLINNVV